MATKKIKSLPEVVYDLSPGCDVIALYDKYMTSTDPTYDLMKKFKSIVIVHEKKDEMTFDISKFGKDRVGTYQRNFWKLSKNGSLKSNGSADIQTTDIVEEFYKTLVPKRKVGKIPFTWKGINSALRKAATGGEVNKYKVDLEVDEYGGEIINLNDVDNPLRNYFVRDGIICPGVNRVTLLLGPQLAISSLHTEDCLFASINVIIHSDGGGKYWVIINPADNKKLIEAFATEYGMKNRCHILGDKLHGVTLQFLDHYTIDYVVQHQQLGHMIVIGSGVYHQVINTGRNIAAAVNIIPTQHLEAFFNYEPCVHKPTELKANGEKFEDYVRVHAQDLTPLFKNLHLEVYKFMAGKISGLDQNPVSAVEPQHALYTDPHKCHGCFMIFSNKSNAIKHYRTVHQLKPATVACDICSMTMHNASLFRHKQRRHIPSTETKWPDVEIQKPNIQDKFETN